MACDMLLCIFAIYIIYLIFSDMSWIKDIKDLSTSTKSIMLTLLPVTLIWFIILFLYFPNIIRYKWYFVLGFSLAPSIFWYGIHIIFVYLVILKSGIDFEKASTDIKFWVAIAFDVLFYLLLISLFPIILHASFYYFLLVLFTYKFGLFLFIGPLSKGLKNRLNKSS